MTTMLLLAAALTLAAAAHAEEWTQYQAPGSPWTEYRGPNGWTGTTYHAPGSPWTDTTFHGPKGNRCDELGGGTMARTALPKPATLLGSLNKARDVKTRDSIGLAVSEVNSCNYCLTVHSFTAEHMAKLPADEIILARKGHATDPKRDAAIQFARKVIETRAAVGRYAGIFGGIRLVQSDLPILVLS